MLTEADKKWLQERKFETCENCKTNRLLCDRCNHIHKFNVWAWNRFSLSGLSTEATYEEILDSAEFEARVVAKLATYAHTTPCEGNKPCPYKNRIRNWSCDRCNLKHARLTVEEEMDNG